MKNRLFIYLATFASIIMVILLLFFFLINYYLDLSEKEFMVVTILTSLLAFTDVVVLFVSHHLLKRKREDIKKSFDHYMEEQVETTGVGVIIYNTDNDIIWTSSFIEKRLGRSIIGKKIYSISPEFEKNYLDGQKSFRFELADLMFETQINIETRTVVLKDVQNLHMLQKQYVSEKLIVGELEIDNFQQFQVTLSEEELFKIQSNVIKVLDSLVEKYNLIYRQYVNGKYIFFTDHETLDAFVRTKFNFLDELRKVEVIDGVNLTVSMGIGSGTPSQKELAELARDGLRQAQARGGDQVALMESNKRPSYFGSKLEIAKTVSKVKIKQTAERFESKLQNPNIKTVIVYGHKFADLDAVGAALGIYEIAKSYGKQAYIQNVTFDTTTQGVIDVLFPKDEMDIFIKPSRATKETNENTMVVLVDNAELERIENPDALASKRLIMDNVFVFDHHRVSKLPSEIPSTNVYIDTAASSASEIVTEVMQFFRNNIKPSKISAQMLLNGIYLDTKNFTKSTASRTYQAASFLENHGAQSNISADIMKIPAFASQIINDIMTKLEEVKQGYFIAAYQGEVPSDIVSMAADEILRTKGRKAAFVVAKTPGKTEFKMSARGIETNVQQIAEAVGGGGHFGSAAATSTESFPIFVDNIRQAIVSKKGDE